MEEKLKQAINDLKYKQSQYMYAKPEFEPTAYREMQAAKAEVDELVKKAKGAKEHVNHGNDMEIS